MRARGGYHHRDQLSGPVEADSIHTRSRNRKPLLVAC